MIYRLQRRNRTDASHLGLLSLVSFFMLLLLHFPPLLFLSFVENFPLFFSCICQNHEYYVLLSPLSHLLSQLVCEAVIPFSAPSPPQNWSGHPGLLQSCLENYFSNSFFDTFLIFFPQLSLLFLFSSMEAFALLPWQPYLSGQSWPKLCPPLVICASIADLLLSLFASPPSPSPLYYSLTELFFISFCIINGIIRFGVYFNEQINHWIKYEIGTECTSRSTSL